MRRAALAVLAGFAVLGLLMAALMAEGGRTGVPGPLPVTVSGLEALVNNPAPDFTAQTLDGETVRLADLRGKVVFLNFWATWCAPCRAEMPAFQQFSASQANAVILAVNDAEPPAAIAAFLADVGVPDVPVLLDANSTIKQQYRVFQMPTTFMIDRRGVIRTVKLGEVKVEDLHGFMDFLAREAAG